MRNKLFNIFPLLFLLGCGDPCVNNVVQESASPDGKYMATAFVRDCGATTDYSPQVYLRKAGKKAGRTGNVFIGNHSDTIQMTWVSAMELSIVSDADIIKKLDSYKGIVITFKKSSKGLKN